MIVTDEPVVHRDPTPGGRVYSNPEGVFCATRLRGDVNNPLARAVNLLQPQKMNRPLSMGQCWRTFGGGLLVELGRCLPIGTSREHVLVH